MTCRMPFFCRSLELVEMQISKFHLTFIIINSRSSSSFTVRWSGWKEDSEKGALIQPYTWVEREGKYCSVLFCNFPQWFGLNLTLETSSLSSASSSVTISGFLFVVWFFPRFNFYLKPIILSLEIKIFSPGPWRYLFNYIMWWKNVYELG